MLADAMSVQRAGSVSVDRERPPESLLGKWCFPASRIPTASALWDLLLTMAGRLLSQPLSTLSTLSTFHSGIPGDAGSRDAGMRDEAREGIKGSTQGKRLSGKEKKKSRTLNTVLFNCLV